MTPTRKDEQVRDLDLADQPLCYGESRCLTGTVEARLADLLNAALPEGQRLR